MDRVAQLLFHRLDMGPGVGGVRVYSQEVSSTASPSVASISSNLNYFADASTRRRVSSPSPLSLLPMPLLTHPKSFGRRNFPVADLLLGVARSGCHAQQLVGCNRSIGYCSTDVASSSPHDKLSNDFRDSFGWVLLAVLVGGVCLKSAEKLELARE